MFAGTVGWRVTGAAWGVALADSTCGAGVSPGLNNFFSALSTGVSRSGVWIIIGQCKARPTLSEALGTLSMGAR